jgi:hypothetical protein
VFLLLLIADSIVDGLAVDSQNHLLFYTDTGRDVICAVTTSSFPVKHTVLVKGHEGMDEPRDIVLSPPDG